MNGVKLTGLGVLDPSEDTPESGEYDLSMLHNLFGLCSPEIISVYFLFFNGKVLADEAV